MNSCNTICVESEKKEASSLISFRPLFWHSGAPDAAASGHKYKKKKSTGSFDSKSWTFPTHHHHPARDCFDCSITCKSTFLAYSFSQLPISFSDGGENCCWYSFLESCAIALWNSCTAFYPLFSLQTQLHYSTRNFRLTFHLLTCTRCKLFVLIHTMLFSALTPA